MYKILTTYSDNSITGLNLELSPIEIPTVQVVQETYTNMGVYCKSGSGICFGEEDSGEKWWSLNPRAGRFEYRVVEKENKVLEIILTNVIRFTVTVRDSDTFPYKYKEDCWLSCIEDCIMLFYLDNKFTRDFQDMTYVFGCRKYTDELIKLL